MPCAHLPKAKFNISSLLTVATLEQASVSVFLALLVSYRIQVVRTLSARRSIKKPAGCDEQSAGSAQDCDEQPQSNSRPGGVVRENIGIPIP
jgi:hypothetical protein